MGSNRQHPDPPTAAGLIEMLRTIVPETPSDLEPTLLFREQVDIDSVDFLNFVLAIEARYSVEVPMERYPACASAEGAVKVVNELRASALSA